MWLAKGCKLQFDRCRGFFTEIDDGKRGFSSQPAYRKVLASLIVWLRSQRRYFHRQRRVRRVACFISSDHIIATTNAMNGPDRVIPVPDAARVNGQGVI